MLAHRAVALSTLKRYPKRLKTVSGRSPQIPSTRRPCELVYCRLNIMTGAPAPMKNLTRGLTTDKRKIHLLTS